jgi:acetoin utilization deacetylase AcuC-like enzyme
VTLLLATHPRYLEHRAGHAHPERPARLDAVLAGVDASGVADAVVRLEPRRARRHELERVHPRGFLDAMARFCAAGGGRLDADTGANDASWDAAVLAAGAGLGAIEALDRGEGDSAFCVVRPPGHHATPDRAMGFCLVNNVAVAAAHLAERGERVVVVDYDAHHGNGTQDTFYADGRVFYVSFHEYPLYPGSGALSDIGEEAGRRRTMNFPLPEGATGDVYLRALDAVVLPVVEQFRPTWLILSAGFDGHRRDPLTGLGLSAGDYALITRRLVELVPAGRRLAVLEGGYDLPALTSSSAAVVAALVGERLLPEEPTADGPGGDVVDAARRLWADLGDL